jgi:type I restriction enzyme S subunit
MILADISEFIVDCEHKTAPTQADGYPSIRTPNIGKGYFILDGVNRVSEETYRLWTKRAVPEAGDIIMAREAPVGNAAIIPEGLQPCLGQRTLLIRPDRKKVEPAFLNYLLNGPQVQGVIHAKTNGVTVPHLNMKDVRELPIPELPTIEVQRRLAGVLCAYDELIENNQRRIRILEEMAHALYREWFVDFRFPGHEKVQPVPSPVGDIPKGWAVKPFAALGSYVNGYAFKPDDWGAEGKPIVKIRELKAGITADTPRNSGDGIPEKYSVRDGDVLFSWSADLDVYLWMGGEALLNQHLFNVVPVNGLSRAFCFHALKEAMPQFRALSLGATMHHIKRSALGQVVSVHPPEALRKRFDLVIEPVHQQIVTLNKRVKNLRRTRDLLLPRFVEGRLSQAAAEGRPRTASARR